MFFNVIAYANTCVLLFLTSHLVGTLKVSSYTPHRCDVKLDLAIILDGSSNINPDDFPLAKSFVSALAAAYEQPSRISFIIYSDNAQVIFNIDNSLNPFEMNEKIEGAIQPRGGTYTNFGINAAIAQLSNSPPGVPRKMVVFTAGVSSNPQATIESAQNAKLNGITAYSVGLGGYSMAELLIIASGRYENVFTAASFHQLFDQICM